MAVYYINPASGSDSNSGLSFATAWKTVTNGATALRIAPGDEIRIMQSPIGSSPNAQWKSLSSNQRLTGSITNATNATPIVITSAAHGLQNGNTVCMNNVGGNTNANGVWVIANVTTNTFELVGSAGNGAYTNSGSFSDISSAVVNYGAGSIAQEISFCGNNGQASCSNWTGSANVNCYLNIFGTGVASYIREGNCSLKINLTSSFATGKAAYQQVVGAPLNLSSFNALTFQIAKESAAIDANEYKIVLCSDTAGATIVDEFVVPASLSVNNMVPFTVTRTGGGSLGSSIRSIALYKIKNDSVATTIYLDNMVAVNSGVTPTLTALINAAKNNGDFTDYYGLMSIRNSSVMLTNGPVSIACDPNNLPYGWYDLDGDNSPYGYPTRSVEPFYIDSAASSSPLCIVNDSGTAGNLITFKGGYNSTDMTNVNGKTFFASRSGYNTIFSTNTKEYLEINNIQVSRGDVGFEFSSCNNSTIVDCSATNMSSTGMSISACSNSTFNSTYSAYPISASAVMSAAFCMQNGFLISGGSENNTFNGMKALSCLYNVKYGNNFNEINGLASYNGVSGMFIYLETVNGPLDIITNNCIFAANAEGITFDASATYGAQFNGTSFYYCNTAIITANLNKGIVFNNTTTSGTYVNTVNILGSSITFNGGRFGYPVADTATYLSLMNSEIYLNRIVGLNSADPINQTYGDVSVAYITDCTNTSAAQFSGTYGPYSSSVLVSTPVHGSTSNSWKMSVGNGPSPWDKNVDAPLALPIAKIAVEANKTVTVSAWFRREDAGIAASLVLPANQLLGLETAVSSSMTAAINTWQQLTISFTPYMQGVVEIQAQAYGSSTSAVYVGDMSVSTSVPSLNPTGYVIGGSCDGGYSALAYKLVYGTGVCSSVSSLASGTPNSISSGISASSTHGYVSGAGGYGGTTTIVTRYDYISETKRDISSATLNQNAVYTIDNTSSTNGYISGGSTYAVGIGVQSSYSRWKMSLATEASYALSDLPAYTSSCGGVGTSTYGYLPSYAVIMKLAFSTDVITSVSTALNNTSAAGISGPTSGFYCAGYTSVCSNACQEFAFSTETLSSLAAVTTTLGGSKGATWTGTDGYLYTGECYDGSGKFPRTDCYNTIDKLNFSTKAITNLAATTPDSRANCAGLNCG